MLNHIVSWFFAVLLSLALSGYSSVVFAAIKAENNEQNGADTQGKAADKSTLGVQNKVVLDKKHPHYIRAVLISKITPYIYWQASAFSTKDSPFNLCIIANNADDVAEVWPYLDLLSGRTSNGRTFNLIEVSPYQDNSTPLPTNCHIYYLGDLKQKHAKALAQSANNGNVLTIGDSMEELYDGAMLAFIEERGRMKIYVNTDAVSSSSLKIKSSLLRIAKKI